MYCIPCVHTVVRYKVKSNKVSQKENKNYLIVIINYTNTNY